MPEEGRRSFGKGRLPSLPFGEAIPRPVRAASKSRREKHRKQYCL